MIWAIEDLWRRFASYVGYSKQKMDRTSNTFIRDDCIHSTHNMTKTTTE